MRKLIAVASRFSPWARHRGEIALKKWATFVTLHQKVVFTITLLITLFSVVGMFRLTVHNNYEADLPSNHPIVQTNNAVKEFFGNEAKTVIGIVADDGDLLTTERLGVVRDIEEIARRLPGSLRVTGLGVTPTIYGEWIVVDGEREWIVVTEPHLAHIPETPEKMDAFKTRVRNDRNFRSLVDPDFTCILVLVETKNSYEIQQPLNEQLNELVRTKSHDGIRIVRTGDLVLNYETDLGIERQVQRYIVVSLIVTLIVVYAAFRMVIAGALLPLLLIALGNCWTLGVIGWTGRPLNVVTHAIPILLIAMAVSYVIRMITAVEHAALDTTKERQTIVANAIVASGDDIVKTGVTAAFGAVTLFTFPVKAIREFGCFFGVGIGLLATLVLGPFASALTLTRERRYRGRTGAVVSIGMRLIPICRFAIKRPRIVLAIAGAVLLFAGAGILQLKVGVSWREFFPRDHEVPRTADLLNERLGYSYSMIMVVDTGKKSGVTDPAMLTGTELLIKAIRQKRSDIGEVRVMTDVIRHVNRVFHEDDPAYDVLPESQEANAEILLASSLATSPGDFSGLVDPERRRVKVTLFLNSYDIEDVREIYELAQKLGPQYLPPSARLSFGGPAMLWVAQTQCVVQGKVQNITFSIATVAIFGIGIFGILLGLLSVIPLAAGTFTTFGIMGWLGIRLNMATSIVTSMAVGFGVDAAFHFLHFFTDPKLPKNYPLEGRMTYAVVMSGRAIVVDTTANAAGFLVFLLSDFSPVRNLGWLVALNLVLSCIGIIIIITICALIEEWRNNKRPVSQ